MTSNNFKQQIAQYEVELEAAMNDLFSRARAANELQFVLSLFPEFRGIQDANWNTAQENDRAFHEFRAYLESERDSETAFRIRIVLAFYCHLSEAAGFYEMLMNIISITAGDNYSNYPFVDWIRYSKKLGKSIPPNSNAVMRAMSGNAQRSQVEGLAGLIDSAFDAGVRNAYSHADYIITESGFRIRNRNLGDVRQVPWPEFEYIIAKGIRFYEVQRKVALATLDSYGAEQVLSGRWPDGRPSSVVFTIDPETGNVRFTDSVP